MDVQPDKLLFDASKVSAAAKTAHTRLSWFRSVYELARDELAGPWHYNAQEATKRWSADSLGADGTQKPINLIDELVSTYIPNLCGTEITAKLTAERTSLRGWATLRQAKLNQELKSMGFAAIDAMVVQDAFLAGQGCYRIGVNQGSDMFQMSSRLGARMKPGQSFVKRVSPKHIIRDPESEDPEMDRFQGMIYTVEKQWALDLGIGNSDVINAMDTVQDCRSSMGRQYSSSEMDLVDMVEFCDMIVFKGGKTYEMTIPAWDCGQEGDFIIEPREYDGCALGMFEYLSFQNVNDRTIGKSPVQTIMDLHLAMVQLGRRAVEQILAAKRNYVYRADQSEVVDNIRSAPPEGFVEGDPQGFLPIIQGGLSDEVREGNAFMRAESNKANANVGQVGGVGTGGGKTATEIATLQGNATVIIQRTKELCNNARINVIRRLSDYEDTYGGESSTLTHEMPDGKKIELTYDPAAREGQWSDFNHDIGVTTSQAQEPNMKQARVAQVMTAAPAFLESVGMLQGNIQAASDMIANQFNIPEFSDIFPTPQAQQIDQAMGQMVPHGQPAGMRMLKGGKATPMAANPSAPINQVRSDYAGSTPTGP